MELLNVYQDLLSTQIQAPESTGSTADEFKERADDGTLVNSLKTRLNEHSPPEPGTSESHAMGIDSQGSVTRYRRIVSQLAAILQELDTEHPDPSSSITKANHRILPSPVEWVALIRECVSSFQDESSMV